MVPRPFVVIAGKLAQRRCQRVWLAQRRCQRVWLAQRRCQRVCPVPTFDWPVSAAATHGQEATHPQRTESFQRPPSKLSRPSVHEVTMAAFEAVCGSKM
jgi:hypothetical protein